MDLVPAWSFSPAVSKPVWHIPLLCVQWKTPDDGQRNSPKRVEFYSKNKFEKLVHIVGFIIRILSCSTVTWTSKTPRFFERSGIPRSVIQIQILKHLNPLTLHYYLHLDFRLQNLKLRFYGMWRRLFWYETVWRHKADNCDLNVVLFIKRHYLTRVHIWRTALFGTKC